MGRGAHKVMGAPLTIISPPQFQDNLQDLLPTLPNADEYFLLRWLRGEAGRVRRAERERGQKGFGKVGGTLGDSGNRGSGISLL